MSNCPIYDCELEKYERGSQMRIAYPRTDDDTGLKVKEKKYLCAQIVD